MPSGPLKGQNVDNKAREEVKLCITHFPAMFEHSSSKITAHRTRLSSVLSTSCPTDPNIEFENANMNVLHHGQLDTIAAIAR